jgi:hypothetical protein
MQSRFNDSPYWKALLKVKDTYIVGRKVVPGNGDTCRLWKDPFVNNIPLCEQFPILFYLCQSQDISLKGKSRRQRRTVLLLCGRPCTESKLIIRLEVVMVQKPW